MESAEQEGEFPLAKEVALPILVALWKKRQLDSELWLYFSSGSVPPLGSECCFVVLPSNNVQMDQNHHMNKVKYKQMLRELLRCLFFFPTIKYSSEIIEVMEGASVRLFEGWAVHQT